MEKKSYGNEQLHKVLLSAMKDIDQICRENNLRYFMHAGTLLGAVVHKGFIPWDDDVDIIMFKDDYNKLANIIQKEYSHKYFFQTYMTDYYHPDNRAKLRIKGTEFVTVGENDKRLKDNGIFLDIAPLYNVPNNRILRLIQKKLIYIIDIIIQIKLGLIIPTSYKTRIFLKPFTKIKRESLSKFMDFIMENMGNENSEKVGILSYTGRNEYTQKDGYENDLFPREFFDTPIYLEFEDTSFMAISEWHKDLLQRYGDKYMEPYPEEKRITKHGLEDFKISEEVKRRLGL